MVQESPFPSDTEQEDLRTGRVVGFSSIFGSSVLLFFALLDLLHGHTLLGLILLATGLVGLCVPIYLRLTRELRQSAYAAGAIMIFVCSFLLLSDTPYNIGFVWSFVLPAFLLFVLGLRAGGILSLLFLFFGLTMLAIPDNPLVAVAHSPGILLRFAISFLSVFFLTAYYERARDVARKSLRAREQDLSLLNKELEKRVDERTAALQKSEEKLRQSAKMEAVGQLAGGIAHDFNNQLAGIVGYADLVKQDSRDRPKLSGYAEKILLAAQRSTDLITQLLAFSRQGKYFNITVDMHQVVQEVFSLISHTFDRRVVLRQELKASRCTILGDPSLLQNVILNLALNARDAMPQGGELFFGTSVAELSEEFCSESPFSIAPGAYLRVDICDTGSGIDLETQKRMFEPFFTTKPQGKGTGMGLAAAYGTIKTHKGAISVSSELGRGGCFQLFIPLVEGQEPPTRDA